MAQAAPTECGMNEGPVVVIPEPIDVMDWTYDVERTILEPLGIQLIVPARTIGEGS